MAELKLTSCIYKVNPSSEECLGWGEGEGEDFSGGYDWGSCSCRGRSGGDEGCADEISRSW